jgi:hypothetical protein
MTGRARRPGSRGMPGWLARMNERTRKTVPLHKPKTPANSTCCLREYFCRGVFPRSVVPYRVWKQQHRAFQCAPDDQTPHPETFCTTNPWARAEARTVVCCGPLRRDAATLCLAAPAKSANGRIPSCLDGLITRACTASSAVSRVRTRSPLLPTNCRGLPRHVASLTGVVLTREESVPT